MQACFMIFLFQHRGIYAIIEGRVSIGAETITKHVRKVYYAKL
jgi:hypothetical protein